MLIEFGQDRDRDDEDFGFAVKIVGRSDLEKALLTHLQDGHRVKLIPASLQEWGELKFVFHNAKATVENTSAAKRESPRKRK